ncbi:MAG TPA: hypothetical protein VKH37_01930 [Ferruginibacter sp.]|nr:hypothetical protein [Ferruginibacter sp.]
MMLKEFVAGTLAFYTGNKVHATKHFVELGLAPLSLDGSKCPTAQDFVQQLAKTVKFPGTEITLSILGQELSNLDWLEGKAFGICITNADLLFKDGNLFQWQYLLEMAWNIQRNVDELSRPPVSWLLQMDEDKIKPLQQFFNEKLAFKVPIIAAE